MVRYWNHLIVNEERISLHLAGFVTSAFGIEDRKEAYCVAGLAEQYKLIDAAPCLSFS